MSERADVVEPKTPTSAVEWQSLSDAELNAIFALAYANEIQAVADQGENALLRALERWEPDMRQTVARALAQVG